MMFHSSTMFEMLVKPDEVIKLKKWYKVLNIREENIARIIVNRIITTWVMIAYVELFIWFLNILCTLK